MKRYIPNLVLAISGVLLFVIGAAVLLDPEAFAAGNGIVLPDSPSLLSEYRAPGGMLAASGIFILFGAVRMQFMRLGFALSALVYGSYGVSRLIAIALDGMPSAALTQAMIIELILGAVCLVELLRLNRSQNFAGQR